SLVVKGAGEVSYLRAAVLGGAVNGSLKMHDVAGAQLADFNATVHNIPLAGIQALVSAQAMKDFRLTGTTNAKLAGNWHKTFDTLMARMDANVAGGLSQVHADRAPSTVPIAADVHANYSAAGENCTFPAIHI